MANVLIPQKKQNPVVGLIPAAIEAVGTMVGGPVGRVAGGLAGKVVAGAAEGGPAPEAVDYTPMNRRQEALDDDPHTAIAQGYKALQDRPELMETYGKAYEEALRLSQKDRGLTYG